MPLVVLVVDLDLHQSVIHDDGSKVLLGLTVIERLPSLLDVGQHALPPLYIVAHGILDLLGIQHPQTLITQPRLNVVAHTLEHIIDRHVDLLHQVLIDAS